MNVDLGTLCKDVIEAARLRRERGASIYQGNLARKLILYALTVKQFESTEAELVESLSPVFKRQIGDIVKRLLQIEEKVFEEQAHILASLVFDPKDWDEEIVNKTLPILALNMAKAGVAQILIFGLDVRKAAMFNRKQTTATEWLERHSGDYDELVGTVETSIVGTPTNILFMSEIPAWMKRSIVEELAVSFSQDYWRDISITTQGDAEVVLRKGLTKGWSIRRMAREMTESLGGDKYAKMRATKIARTESGGALNSARRASIDQLMTELGPEMPIKPAWLSVLSDTTRGSHANLDGVPADQEGLWNLDGVRIPWPSHYTLPPENRINCLCSIITELGMTDLEAQQLIAEHEQRVLETNTEVG